MELQTDDIITMNTELSHKQRLCMIYHIHYSLNDMRSDVLKTLMRVDGIYFRLKDGRLFSADVSNITLSFSPSEVTKLTWHRIIITCENYTMTQLGEGEFLQIGVKS